MTATTISSLQQLRDALTEVYADLPRDERERAEIILARAAEYGLPTHSGDVDWTELPVFAGGEGEWPGDTRGIWSWDATHMLVGDLTDGLQIVPRDEA